MNDAEKRQAVNDAVDHIMRVAVYADNLIADPRITNIINSQSNPFKVYVKTPYGVRVRGCPSLDCNRIGGLPYRSIGEVIQVQGDWGMIAPGEWITLNPLYVTILD